MISRTNNNSPTIYTLESNLSNCSVSQFALNQLNDWNNTASQCPFDFYQEQNYTELNSNEFEFEESVAELLRNRNLEIKKAGHGVNEAPILYDASTDTPIAIFKSNNGARTTAKWGDVIAYRLDHGSFAKVPYAFRLTHLPESFSKRECFLSGSFVKWISEPTELTETEFAHLEAKERQAIYILDFRLGNNDRHFQNILRDKKGRLIPIDHDMLFLPYMYIPACKDELLCEECRDYILNLDLNKDIEILKEYEVPEIDIENFVIRTILLKLAAEEPDITIGELAHIMQLTRLLSASKMGKFAAYFLSTNLWETFSMWYWGHPLNKIFAGCSIPYNEIELKAAFSESFENYYAQVKGIIITTEMSRAIIKMLFC